MKFKLLMVIGVVAPSFAIGAPAAAAERHSDMVIAQAQQQGDKDKDQRLQRGGQSQKQGQPAGTEKKTGQPTPVQKPVVQQQQQQQQNKLPQQPAQLQKPERQELKKLPPQHSEGVKQQTPVQVQKQPQPDVKKLPPVPPRMEGVKQPNPVQVQKPAQQELKKLPSTPQQSEGVKQQTPVQVQKPVQQEIKKLPSTPQQSEGVKQQTPVQVQKPVMEKPAFDKNKGPAPTIQTQQPPVMTPGNQRLDQVRGERREVREGNRIVIHEQNRTITRENGRTFILHDDTDRFRRGERDVRVEHRGNETETIIIRPDGVRIIIIVDGNGRLLRRIRREPDGREFVLIDNRHMGPPGAFGFIASLAAPVVRMPRERYIVDADRADDEMLYETLIAPPVMTIDRPYTLDEIRYTYNLREWMPRIDLDTITFETGSWEVTPDQARLLEPIAAAMRRAIRRNPNEVYLIEGHTDAVGSDIDNLSLSDRRAETVAEILTQDFGIPPENLTTQGYGEQYLKIPTPGPERRNRRVTVRRITPLLTGQN